LILVAPPGVPHGFRFSENVVGDVLSLRVNELEGDTVDRIVAWQGAGGGILTQGTSRHFGDVQTLVAQLAATYHGLEPERRPLLKALTQLIVVYVSSDLQRKNPVGAVPDSLQPTRHEDQAERFCKLVEANFQSPWTVADYAKAAGVSTPHLTRVCRRVLGVSPNELVRQRRLLEARRLLEYTRLPIAEVAHNSGFRDPAFFSRTFKRDVGLAPQDYRKAHT
jgi:AraC family transcriptional activator of pobA